MSPKLYYTPASPPSRAVLMTAHSLGLELQLHVVDFTKRETLAPSFLKMNPQHTVPTLVEEDGYILWDSHAINAYLVGKYGVNDSLYPKDLRRRATVDQRLHFDNGVIFPLVLRTMSPIFYHGAKIVPYERIQEMNDAYPILNTFLKNSKFVAGDELTIADFSIHTTITVLNLYTPVDAKKYPNLSEWFLRLNAIEVFKTEEKGVEFMKAARNGVTLVTC